MCKKCKRENATHCVVSAGCSPVASCAKVTGGADSASFTSAAGGAHSSRCVFSSGVADFRIV